MAAAKLGFDNVHMFFSFNTNDSTLILLMATAPKTQTIVDEWKHDDLVQRRLRQLGGAGKHPVLHQLHPEAARVPHLRGHLS